MNHCILEKKIHAIGSGAIVFCHKHDIGRNGEHKLHLNDHLEIYIFVKGDTHYLVGDQYYILEPGDILVISPYSPHVPILKSECEYERFYLLFPTDALSDYAARPLQSLLQAAHHQQALIRLPEQERTQAMNLLYRMSELSLSSSSTAIHTELLLHSLAVQFLCILNIYNGGQTSHSVPEKAVPRLVRDTLEYIHTHATETIGIAPIAAHFYISKQHLATVFKQHVGVTVNEYLLTQKISKAKQLLEQSCSVTFACYESGFNDCSYFIKVFKRMVGMTPNKYMQKYLNP